VYALDGRVHEFDRSGVAGAVAAKRPAPDALRPNTRLRVRGL
jgi:hypothetical protein